MADERRQFARRLRRQATGPEDVLWELLRGRRLDGLKFRRQEPLLGYTVDFLCPERKLVIELDGRQHGWDQGYDASRTVEIERHGFMLIRFRNDEVLDDRDAVIARIRAEGFYVTLRRGSASGTNGATKSRTRRGAGTSTQNPLL